MRKVVLVAVMALISFNAITAQEDGIRFGAKAGLNFANFSGDVSDDLKSRTSFHLGAVVEIPLTESFAFQPELVYSSQGAKIDEGDIKQTTKLDYFNIPLMFKYYVAEGFSLQAGPQAGFLVSSKAVLESAEEETDIDLKEFTNSLDLALNFGLGYQLKAGLFFDARYNLGLANIIKEQDGEDEGESDFSTQNNVIALSVGYKF